MNERKWYEIRAQAGAAEVYIYEQIGEDLFGEGVSAKNFCAELAALDVASIALHVNCPGGSVFDGQAIYNAVRRHPARGHQLRRRRRRLDSQRGRPGRRPRRDGAQRPVHDPRPLRPALRHRDRAPQDGRRPRPGGGHDHSASTARRPAGRTRRSPGRWPTRPGSAPRRRSSSASSTRSPQPLRVAASFDLSGFGYRRPPVQAIDALPPAEIDDAGRVPDQATKDACTAEPAAEAGAPATAAEARPSRRLVLAGDRFVTFSEGRKR